MNRTKPCIYKPIDNVKIPVFKHAGDTFREMIDLWEQAGLVEVVLTSDGFVWLDDEQRVLLYDRPTMQWWNKAPPTNYEMVLFGNEVPTQLPRAYPWIFWGRRPRLLAAYEQRTNLPGFAERKVTTVFIGKIENNIQQRYRDPRKWSEVIEEFSLVIGAQAKYPYTQAQYLRRLLNARYGLCLRGYGPKCNREIELMALGTVPIVTPEVDMLAFFDPPREGIHYFLAKTPADIATIVQNTSAESWTKMSKACRDWHRRNASVASL